MTFVALKRNGPNQWTMVALRRGSTVLRQLLVQNELQRAWKAAGFEREPQIKASSLASILNQFPKEKIHFARQNPILKFIGNGLPLKSMKAY